MPAPAVYIPERALPPGTCAKWGFEPVGGTFHYARHRDLTLAADINSSDTMDLLIVPASVFAPGAGDVVSVQDPQVLAVGHFSDPHPRDWKDAIYAAARRVGGLPGLLVVVGPDDYPRLGTPGLRARQWHARSVWEGFGVGEYLVGPDPAVRMTAAATVTPVTAATAGRPPTRLASG
jgi:hypothetical protein